MVRKNLIKKGLAISNIILFIGISVTPSASSIIGESKFQPELIIDGPTQGNAGEELEYDLLLTNQEGCNDIWYYADWGDGTYFDWWGPVHSGIYLGLIHTWDEGGVYIISAKAKDCEGSIYNATLEVTINGKPDKPNIYGPVEGKKGEEYEFVFSTEDPEGDNVSYYVEWQDGTSTGWTDYFASGEDVKVKHVWKQVDDYLLRCKAKDIYCAESDWSYYEITIPKSKQIFNLPYLQFLMIIFQFPLLQRLLEWLM